MRVLADLAPLWRSGVGPDRLLDLAGSGGEIRAGLTIALVRELPDWMNPRRVATDSSGQVPAFKQKQAA
jgi:hypothetical protein